MKIIHIKIDKSNIFADVGLSSAYIEAKEDAAKNRIATMEQDEALLKRLWSETCGEVTEKLRTFITASEISDEEISLTLELSGSYEDAQTPTVISDIKAALVAGITARWFRYTYPDRSAEWSSESTRLLDRAFSHLCHRKKPVRG